MEIPKEYFDLTVRTLKRIEDQCKAATSGEEALYFFSASFGVINRVMNFHCDPMLVFIHQVLQATHQAITARLNAPRNPNNESFLGVPREMYESLLSYYHEFITAFESQVDSAIWAVLQKFANLSYATTGNGFYLYLTGQLSLR
jgi:hypothetical protein